MVQTIVGFSRGQVQAAIDANVAAELAGLLRTDYLETVDARQSSGVLSSGALAAGIYLSRVLPHRVPSVTKLGAFLGATVAGNIGFGLYTWDGTAFALVGGSTVAAASGANAVSEHAVSAIAVPETPNLFLAVGNSDATLTVFRLSATLGLVTKATASYFKAAALPALGQPMPASIATPALTNLTPWVYGNA